MGYTPKSTVYTLDFEGTEQEGLEVRMRAAKIGQVFGDAGLLGVVEKVSSGQIPSAEDMELGLDKYRQIADHLVSWNIEIPAGTPLPADLDGLKQLEVPLVKLIAETWQRAMTDVAAPLPVRSSGGLPDVPIPMAEIPASLLNSSMSS